MNIFYHELLKIENLNVEFVGNPTLLDKKIQNFSINSRTIQQNEVFFAIKGERFDGHNFIFDVLKKGITACVASKSWFQSQDKTKLNGNFFLVLDTLIALQEISRYCRLKHDIPVIALTGSNGKTTSKEMIAAVLGKKYNVLKTEGNLNNHIGVPLTLFSLNTEHEIAIIEMGANGWGEIARLSEIVCPSHGLITNIGPAHLEFFGSLEGVFKAKSELWQNLEHNKGIAFINIDDDYLCKNIPQAKKVITYGFDNQAEVRGKFISINQKGQPVFNIEKQKINLKIAGIHNIYNALAAVTVGLEFGLTIQEIKSVLEKFQAASQRMEILEKKGITIINDCYNSNPESAKKALFTLSQMETKGKRMAVLGDMFELGEHGTTQHELIGEYCSSLKNINILFAHGPLSLFAVGGARKSGIQECKHFNDKRDLISRLLSVVQNGDLILIKGSRGMAMEDVTNALLKS
jgi:UDP-N-acetylmuramoyl-tripeptide--D-alanyl-D-alanine ligase